MRSFVGVLALAAFRLLKLERLGLEGIELVGQIVEGVIEQPLLFRAEHALQIGMLNAENFSLIGQFRLGHGFQQPLRGGDGMAIGQTHSRAAADAKEGVARDGIEGLDAAVEQDRQPAEASQIETVHRLWRLCAREKPQRKQTAHDEGNPLFHASLLCTVRAGWAKRAPTLAGAADG